MESRNGLWWIRYFGILVLFYGIGCNANAETLTVSATKDTYVHDGSNSTNNFGTETRLVLRNGSEDFNRMSYLAFPFSVDPSTVGSAQLKLTVATATRHEAN